jgi:hypothetical protein
MTDGPPNVNARCTPKRTNAQRMADLVIVEREHLKGKTHQEIADMLNGMRPYVLTRQQITYDLAKLADEWRERSAAAVDVHRAKELAGLTLQEAELWQEWERSKEERKRQTVTTSLPTAAQPDGAPDTAARKGTAQVVREIQGADASYQALLLKIRERRAKLLGLDAPTRLSDFDGGPLPVAAPASPATVVIYIPSNGRDVKTPEPPPPGA